MKDAQKMMSQMMTSWADTQKQMIDQWLDTVEEPSRNTKLWHRTLSVWESSVKRTMEAQNATMQSWMSQLQDVEGMPDEAAEQVEQGKAIVKQWTETQTELWEKWFETMQQMDPAHYESNWQEMAQQSVAAWRSYMDRLQEMGASMGAMAQDLGDDEASD